MLSGHYGPPGSNSLPGDEERSEFASQQNDLYYGFERTHLREDLLAVVSDLRDRVEKGERSNQADSVEFEMQPNVVESNLNS